MAAAAYSVSFGPGLEILNGRILGTIAWDQKSKQEKLSQRILSMSTHDFLLFFSNKGRVYRMKGYEVPEFSRQSKGLPIVNLLPLEKEENISSILRVSPDDDQTKYLLFCTKNGIVKRTAIEEFDNIRKSGKIAIFLREDDELISVKKTCGNNNIVIGASNGRMVRFDENEIRCMGRSSSGVKGMDLDGSIVVGADVVDPGYMIFIVTENGYGKKSLIDEYRLTHRGSKGVKAYNITEKNGLMVGLKCFKSDLDLDLIIMTDVGTIIKLPFEQVSTLKRATQGVRLINLKDDQKVSTIALVEKEKEIETDENTLIEDDNNNE